MAGFFIYLQTGNHQAISNRQLPVGNWHWLSSCTSKTCI